MWKMCLQFSAVVILCFLCTVTTNFEYELNCSTVGFDFVSEERCARKSENNNELCGMDAFNATCQLVGFDASSGKPCALNQTNTSGSCQKVLLENSFSSYFHRKRDKKTRLSLFFIYSDFNFFLPLKLLQM